MWPLTPPPKCTMWIFTRLPNSSIIGMKLLMSEEPPALVWKWKTRSCCSAAAKQASETSRVFSSQASAQPVVAGHRVKHHVVERERLFLHGYAVVGQDQAALEPPEVQVVLEVVVQAREVVHRGFHRGGQVVELPRRQLPDVAVRVDHAARDPISRGHGVPLPCGSTGRVREPAQVETGGGQAAPTRLPGKPATGHTVQVCISSAPARRAVRTASRTSSGLIG